jgi:hypothetical protein
MKRIVLLIAVAGAIGTYVSAYSGRHDDGAPSSAPAAGTAATSSAGRADATVPGNLFARTRLAVGRMVGGAMAPALAGMAAGNSTAIAALQPAIRRAPPQRQDRARDIERRIAVADSLAMANVAAGRPIDALRQALRARSLVDAARQQVALESIR